MLVREKEYNLIFKKSLYNSPTIVIYNKMESVSHDEQMVCNESEITNNTGIDDDLMNNNELQNIDDTEIEDTSPDNDISYYEYYVICESLYNDIKNDNQISNYVIGLLLETREDINKIKNKHIVISRLLHQNN